MNEFKNSYCVQTNTWKMCQMFLINSVVVYGVTDGVFIWD